MVLRPIILGKRVQELPNFFDKDARELLYDLENPLTPISERGGNAREYIEQEKEFYKKFIENLEKIV